MKSKHLLKSSFFIFFVIVCLALSTTTYLYSRAQGPFNMTVKVQDGPDVEIKKTFYINMDKSVKRNEEFLQEYNAPWPLVRIPGVVATSKIGSLSKGCVGCTMAHANALQALVDSVSKDGEGWYLICEDDCVGDFQQIATNSFVKTIVNTTDKKMINLSKIVGEPSHSLNRVKLRLRAYLVHSSFAQELKQIILDKMNDSWLVDRTTSRYLKEPRFPFYYGNGQGSYVNLMDFSRVQSDRILGNKS
jgi:hypothetical protein